MSAFVTRIVTCTFTSHLGLICSDKMALSQATNKLEEVIGHTGDATTEQNMTNPARDPSKYADPSGEKMKALAWMGKNDVKISR